MARVDVAVSQLLPFQRVLTKEQQDVIDLLKPEIDNLTAQVQRMATAINGQLGFGHPRDENGDFVVDNMYVSWHTQTLDAVGELAVATTITHNFDLPVFSAASPGDTVFLPNVFWVPVRWQYGDITVNGSGGFDTDPPTSLVHGQPIGTIYRESGDTVTKTSIDLRFDINFVPTSTTPVTVDFMLMQGVR